MKSLAFVLISVLAASAARAEPFGWRGDGTGNFAGASAPTSWSKDKNVLWKAPLPKGYNSPVYADGRIFVTAEPALVVAIDAKTGKEQWRAATDYEAALGADKAAEIKRTHQQFHDEKRMLREPFEKLKMEDPQAKEPEELKEKMAELERRHDAFEKQFPLGQRGGTDNVAATPVTDGKRVYAVFATGIVAAFTTGGDKVWVRHVEAPPLGFGQSASPVIADGKLVVQLQNMIALDPDSGDELWRTKLPAKHGSPVTSQIDGQPILITPSGSIVRARDGKVLAEKLFDLSDNSPLVNDGVIYAHQSGSVLALRLPSKIAEPLEVETLWETKAKGEQRMTSATYHDGLLYAGNRRGILDVIDANDGQLRYQKRLQVGELFPSIAVANDQIHVTGNEGKTVVLEPGTRYAEIGHGELERMSSSPIFVGDRAYFRTDSALYCIGTAQLTSQPEKE